MVDMIPFLGYFKFIWPIGITAAIFFVEVSVHFTISVCCMANRIGKIATLMCRSLGEYRLKPFTSGHIDIFYKVRQYVIVVKY